MQTPVTLITGFLGAGKTTLICNLIKASKGKSFAVLVNEFGETSIDGSTIGTLGEENQVDTFDIEHSLLAYEDDVHFDKTIADVVSKRKRYDHVLMETSGLAAPTAAIEQILTAELSKEFKLDATICVIDTPELLSGSFAAPNTGSSISDSSVSSQTSSQPDSPLPDIAAAQEVIHQVFLTQLTAADVVVLNKIDHISHEALHLAEEMIRSAAPSVRFIELAFNAQIEKELALGLSLNEPVGAALLQHSASKGQTSNSSLTDGHSHSGLGPHAHGLLTHQHIHEHDPGWVTFALHSHSPQVSSQLKDSLEQIATSQSILRLKGEFYDGKEGCRLTVQGVSARIIVEKQLQPALAYQEKDSHRNHSDSSHGTSAQDSRIIFIGYHLSRASVAEKLNQLTGAAWH